MLRFVSTALVAGLLSSSAAMAAESLITMPDGWKVHVKTTQSGSIVTNFDPDGAMESRLRYPDYAGEDRHKPLLMLLTPEGATTERIE